MPVERVFSETVKSCINELYPSDVEVDSSSPQIQILDQKITPYKLQYNAVQSVDFITTVPKNEKLVENIKDSDVRALVDDLNRINRSNQTCVVEVCKVCHMDGVKFFNSKVKDGKCYAPRMQITVDAAKIGRKMGVRINTGYVFLLPMIVNQHAIVNGKLEVNKFKVRQSDFVIMPTIVSSHPGLIPSMYVRDLEDTGLVTINFTTTSQFAETGTFTMNIVFTAFTSIKGAAPVSIQNSTDSLDQSTEVFKSKDSKLGRMVKNPKILYDATHFDTDSVNGSLLLRTLAEKNYNPIYHDSRFLQIGQVTTVFASRKREWCNPHVVSLTGIYKKTPGAQHQIPMVANNSDHIANIHSMTFINEKCTLFNVVRELPPTARIINGSFANITDYKNVVNQSRKFVAALSCMNSGVKICRQLANDNGYDIEKLQKYFDYNRSIDRNDVDLHEKINVNDKIMFDESTAKSNAYSVEYMKALKSILLNVCSKMFSAEQLEEIKTVPSLSSLLRRPSPSTNNGDVENSNDGPTAAKCQRTN